MHFFTLTLLASVLGLLARAAPLNETSVHADAVGNRLVFAHFMVIVSSISAMQKLMISYLGG